MLAGGWKGEATCELAWTAPEAQRGAAWRSVAQRAGGVRAARCVRAHHAKEEEPSEAEQVVDEVVDDTRVLLSKPQHKVVVPFDMRQLIRPLPAASDCAAAATAASA